MGLTKARRQQYEKAICKLKQFWSFAFFFYKAEEVLTLTK